MFQILFKTTMCVFVGGCVSLGLVSEVLDTQDRSMSLGLFVLHADSDIEFSATSPALCLPAYCHVFCYKDNGLNL